MKTIEQSSVEREIGLQRAWEQFQNVVVSSVLLEALWRGIGKINSAFAFYQTRRLDRRRTLLPDNGRCGQTYCLEGGFIVVIPLPDRCQGPEM